MNRKPAHLLPFVAAALLFAAACSGRMPTPPPVPAPAAPPPAAPVQAPQAAVRFLPEMTAFPEQKWRACPAGAFTQETRDALAAWAALRPAVERQVTAEKARELSRWAREQMKSYAAVPPLGSIAFAPAAASGGRLLLEGTADTLPSHSRLVTRWLKLFLVYDCGTRTITDVIVTIRGELQE